MTTHQEAGQGGGLTPKLLLLAACASRRQAGALAGPIREAAGNISAWQEVVAAVHRHRMAAIVWKGLNIAGCSLPADVEVALRNAATRDIRQIVRLVAEAATIQALLAASGLKVMMAKGPALSLQAFGDMTLRQCRDLDLLVKPDDILQARRILIDAGFNQNFPKGMDDESELKLWLWMKKDLAFDGPSGATIELHSRLQRNPHIFNEATLQHESVRLAPNVTVEALSGDDLFIYLCLHGSGHLWERMKWLADVAALIDRDPSRLPLLWKRARAEGSAVAVGLALRLCNRIFGTEIPPQIRRDLDRIWRLRFLEANSFAAMTDKETGPERKFGSTKMILLTALLRLEPRFILHEMAHALIDWSTVAAFGGTRRAVFFSILLRPATWSWTAVKRLRGKENP